MKRPGRFDWLEREVDQIKTPKFHIFDSRSTSEEGHAIQNLAPPSYRAFLGRFGGASLYRIRDAYRVRVKPFLEPGKSLRGETLWCFGYFESSRAYFKESLLRTGRESPVFEWGLRLQKVAPDFSTWLRVRCSIVRKSIGKKRWIQVLNGPAPFSECDRRIVSARKLFRWKLVGVGESGDHRIEIFNGSRIVLPFFSLGVRKKGGLGLQGGVWLRVRDIKPGERRIIEQDCYKDMLTPDEVEIYDLPDPAPEDRENYWEFKPLT
jgi:hypothetical protein